MSFNSGILSQADSNIQLFTLDLTAVAKGVDLPDEDLVGNPWFFKCGVFYVIQMYVAIHLDLVLRWFETGCYHWLYNAVANRDVDVKARVTHAIHYENVKLPAVSSYCTWLLCKAHHQKSVASLAKSTFTSVIQFAARLSTAPGPQLVEAGPYCLSSFRCSISLIYCYLLVTYIYIFFSGACVVGTPRRRCQCGKSLGNS
jgi:hypothetical protein